MEENPDNVVSLIQPKPPKQFLLNVVVTDEKQYSQKRCLHKAVEVSEAERVLHCTQCGSALDPFEYILQCATEGRTVVTEIVSLHKRREDLRESVANLEREEKNTKARLRSARTAIAFAENGQKSTEQGVKQ